MRTSVFALAALALLMLPFASAQYADLTMTVDDAGIVTIAGTTNSVELAPGAYDSFTSKTHEFWLLNITTNESFETYVYSVELPAGATVNYVSGKNVRLASQGDAVLVKGSGSGPVTLAIQYKLVESKEPTSVWTWLPLVALIIILAGLWAVIRRRKQQTPHSHETPTRSASQAKQETATPAPKYLDGLPNRQRDIIGLLNKAGGTLTQRQIELTLKLPKSSVSRNVEALRRRGILKKAQIGMTNTVSLEDAYR